MESEWAKCLQKFFHSVAVVLVSFLMLLLTCSGVSTVFVLLVVYEHRLLRMLDEEPKPIHIPAEASATPTPTPVPTPAPAVLPSNPPALPPSKASGKKASLRKHVAHNKNTSAKIHMTQKQIILARLQNGQWFSTVECVRDFHILRLGARIWDLRQEGYEIEERKVEGKSWSEYRLRPSRPITLPPAFPEPEVNTNNRLF
jgi:hypothetical protein